MNKMLYYIKLKAHKMLLALLIFSNIIVNLTESHFIFLGSLAIGDQALTLTFVRLFGTSEN
jgi:hypothetical protein